MAIDKTLIESINNINEVIIETALNVNQLSHTRKQITSESLLLMNELVEKNSSIRISFTNIYKNLHQFMQGMSRNLSRFKNNDLLFESIISNIEKIKKILQNTADDIKGLMKIVEQIRGYTEETSILATNASIESSKYRSTSSVFEILSERLNHLSSFINDNLESIVSIVDPINNGINHLIENNSLVLVDIKKGHQSYTDFSIQLGNQEKVINELIQKAYISESKIEVQKERLNEINNQVIQMDKDASLAIDGSGNVMNIGKNIKESVLFLDDNSDNGKSNDDYIEKIDFITERAGVIWQTAQNVNMKSKSQLDFSLSSLEFCDSIISESKEMEVTISSFNKESINSNKLTTGISSMINDLIAQLDEIELRILDSNETLNRFIEDYLKINNIVFILQKILKMMKIIGIYSRIESSRDPVEYRGFITISNNIQQLQNKIKETLPHIENNIESTNQLIESVNFYYTEISSMFYKIRESSNSITNNLEEISTISSNDEKISKSILDDSLNLDTLLNDLRNYLVKLTEVVKKPIEGSAANIQRGKEIEEKSKRLKGMIQ